MAAPVMPQSNQSVGQQSTTLQSNAPIDVEAIDDDVVLLPSSRDFPQGRNKSRRTRPITVILDEDLDVQVGPSETSGKRSSARPSANNHSRQKVSSKGTVINCEIYEKSELGHEPKLRTPEGGPKEPAFTCSICWGQLVEETSTICGHIFCQGCIKAAIHTQKKCPTCRRPLTMKNIHRVYLSVTN
ncbi:unnamed protein product [Spirodela intermedia]|uniref:RING-type domain-containing protein n=1 Tax=Spirodela intermedia TaxID=51605 RepID=A0A7I8JCI6_SPIIN|nr:unnamed protein product [Spirodela intermedia]CAA6667898.1 unnamed protein product [Spirodela intermedia]